MKNRAIDKKAFLEAVTGAINMAHIYQDTGTVKCLKQLVEKVKSGDFDLANKELN